MLNGEEITVTWFSLDYGNWFSPDYGETTVSLQMDSLRAYAAAHAGYGSEEEGRVWYQYATERWEVAVGQFQHAFSLRVYQGRDRIAQLRPIWMKFSPVIIRKKRRRSARKPGEYLNIVMNGIV